MIARCGTATGYRAHLRAGDRPCQPCADAHAQARMLYKTGDRPEPEYTRAEIEVRSRRYDSATWMTLGACAGVDTDVFFPVSGDDWREAKQICGLCPVRRECLEYALEHGEKYGIWGGKSEKERRRLRGQRRRMASLRPQGDAA